MGGGVLEGLEGEIRLEGLGDVLGALRVERVVVEAANEGANGMSALLTVGSGQAAAYSSEVSVEFVWRLSERCFAPSAPMELLQRLRTRVRSGCQRLLSVRIGREAAHLRLVSVLLTISASERYSPASVSSSLPARLQRESNRGVSGADSRIQVGGGVPDGGEGGICFEEIGNDLCTLYLQLVAANAANEGANGVSALTVEKRRVGFDTAVRGCAYLSVSRFGIAPLEAR